MGIWSWLTGDTPNHVGEEPNDAVSSPMSVGPPDWVPGDPDGVEFAGDWTEETRSTLPSIFASPWSGWPAEWSTPEWAQTGLASLVDTAWACLDLNSSVLSTMPVFKTKGDRVVDPETWMANPDPAVYTSWSEFAKQLFCDYQCGEAFVLATDYFANGFPSMMRVIPPFMVNVEMQGMTRRYSIGSVDITDDVLHIRYKSAIGQARGIGPLDVAGARLSAAGVLARYVAEVAQTGGVPYMTIETDQPIDNTKAQEILDRWMASRRSNIGAPAVLGSGAKAVPHQTNPKDMALIELAQFTESRIAVLLGVPPFLVGLPSGGDSLTYTNVSALFDYHDRASLRPKATAVMSALSQWALPRGQNIELNSDEYSRPSLPERVTAYQTLVTMGAMTPEQVAKIERIEGDAATSVVLPGGES